MSEQLHDPTSIGPMIEGAGVESRCHVRGLADCARHDNWHVVLVGYPL